MRANQPKEGKQELRLLSPLRRARGPLFRVEGVCFSQNRVALALTLNGKVYGEWGAAKMCWSSKTFKNGAPALEASPGGVASSQVPPSPLAARRGSQKRPRRIGVRWFLTRDVPVGASGLVASRGSRSNSDPTTTMRATPLPRASRAGAGHVWSSRGPDAREPRIGLTHLAPS